MDMTKHKVELLRRRFQKKQKDKKAHRDGLRLGRDKLLQEKKNKQLWLDQTYTVRKAELTELIKLHVEQLTALDATQAEVIKRIEEIDQILVRNAAALASRTVLTGEDSATTELSIESKVEQLRKLYGKVLSGLSGLSSSK